MKVQALMPMISIVVPTYNRENLVIKAISSVQKQTYNNIEIIIVDDASIDNTCYAVKLIDDSRIRYVRNSCNKGAQASRNIGVDIAVGEYIAFLDSDDEWNRNKILKQFNYTRSYGGDWICYTQIQYNINNKMVIGPERGLLWNESILDYLYLHRGIIQTSTFFLPKKTFQKCRFDVTLKKHHDPDLCLRLWKMGVQFLFINEPLCRWNNDNRNDRITHKKYPTNTIKWLYKNCPEFSSEAFESFFKLNLLSYTLSLTEKEMVTKFVVSLIKEELILFTTGMRLLNKINE